MKLSSLPGTLSSPLKLADRGDHGGRCWCCSNKGSCIACDELHRDTLSRSELAYALTNLDVAQVDLRSTDLLQTPMDASSVHVTGHGNSASNMRRAWFSSTGRATRCFAPRPTCERSTCMERSITWYPAPIAGNLRFNASCSTGQRCWRARDQGRFDGLRQLLELVTAVQ